MDLFNATRKSILQVISKKKSSASTIAKEVNLSLPYTLSQLAILEAAGQISKNKSPLKAHGKPKLLYSISKSFMELTIITKHIGGHFICDESQPLMETYLQIVAAIPRESMSAYSEYFWKHSEHQHKIRATGLLSRQTNTIELLVITDKEYLNELRNQVSHFESRSTGKTVKIACWVHTIEEIVNGIKTKDKYYEDIYNKVKPIVDKKEVFNLIEKEIKQ